MKEFINLLQGGMTVKEHSLKFTQLSNNSPIVFGDSRSKMNKFIMKISDLLVNEYRLAI